MNNICESLRQKMHYKKVSPVDTVNRIKQILHDNLIEVEEDWLPKSSASTFSLRLSIKGTTLGSNGKGLTKEFARASAYAELMERMQNCWMARFYFRKRKSDKYYMFFDELKMPIEEVLKMDNSFIKMLYKSCNKDSANYDDLTCLNKLHKFEYILTGDKENYHMVPFYSKNNKGLVYLPYNLYMSYYGSNGMCAGNSDEEALIQGLSEIIERYVQKQLLLNNYSLPDIPEYYIKRYPEIYLRYKKIQEIKGYKFMLKDCSLGGRYPVAALIVIEENTGFYGIKLGCHPDYGIAIERALTEAAQGGEITEFSHRSKLNFNNYIVKDDFNISNTYKTGKGQYPYEILLDKPSFDFKLVKDVSDESDEVILKYIMDEVIGKEKDIYIRNVSSLGFPSFHIIIPEFSEMNSCDINRFNTLAAKIVVENLLNNPKLINKDNCKILIYVLNALSYSDIDNTLRSLYGTLINYENLPAEENHLGWGYLIAMGYVYMGEYNKASKYMESIIEVIAKDVNSKNLNYYKAVYQYLNGMDKIENHNTVIRYLENFYSEDICRKIDEIFIDKEQVFIKQYPAHNYSEKSSCENTHCCDYHKYIQLVDMVRKQQEKRNINQESIGSIIHTD